ncbi:MAG: DUF1553 domain-containing protein, partial [Planctomycetes bacterium]|nr:DUF1553 domain-containing protein [Planctomycetota bacterium]
IRHHTQGADFFNETHYLKRGDCEQKDGVAEPSFLQVLTRHPDGAEHWSERPPESWRTSYRRRSLANWITDVEHGPGQLAARVIVNRLWQHHMGRGLVGTPNDFGKQGERPSHPELLDWLAARLIENGWRLKPIHRLIVTSAVYRQSSGSRSQQSEVSGQLSAVSDQPTAAGASTDSDSQPSTLNPQPFLWSRFEPQRLEAEVIRDAMLAAAGTLERRMYGSGTLDETHRRRSIYFMVKRSKLLPTMVLFDAPEPLVSVGDRPATTIAPQALYFMNNEQVRERAREFGARLAKSSGKGSLEEAVTRGYLIALARCPTEAELAGVVAFLEQQTGIYLAAGRPEPAARDLALVDLAQVLLSLNEFVYVE